MFSLWDETDEKWIERNILESNLPITWYLPYEVYLEENITVADVLDLLSEYTDQINFIFINYSKGIPFEEIVKCLVEAKPKKSNLKIDSVCLLWIGELSEADEEFDEVEIYPAMMALEIDETDPDGENDQLYNISELNIKQLMNSNLVLDDILEIYRTDGSEEIAVSAITSWTLFDFIRGLLNDLLSYAIINRLLLVSEFSKVPPLNSEELFNHLDNLDKFFKSGQNDN